MMSKLKFFFPGLLCLVLATIIQSTSALQHSKIDPELKAFFSEGERLHQRRFTSIIISMNESNSKPLAEISSRSFTSREDRLNSITTSLEEFASKSQKNVLNFLHQKKLEREGRPAIKIQVLWISNQIIVRCADSALVEELEQFEEIRAISNDKKFQLFPSIQSTLSKNTITNTNTSDYPWGIEVIDAPSVWKGGNRGEGIVVATIDSGVQVTHEALKDNYVGKYGWHDPIEDTKEPNDQNGHGTHVTGTIAGTKRNIGVAPGSKWMACKGCGPRSCDEIDLLQCGQWILCPTDGANNRNCSKAPNLVSNSWGSYLGNQTFYDPIIEAWRAAEIIPIFALGNSGPECGTAGSPGDRPGVIGVGATTINNTTADFSSRGPTIDGGRIKPDVAAPGVDTLSSSISSDSGYVSYSGTSMACPHVAGLVALLLSEKKSLRFDDVKEALCAGSKPVKSEGQTCGGRKDTESPNNQVGCGQIHALRSILFVRASNS